MILLKMLRKLGKLIRGGASDRALVLGALLGVFIGMIPGFNMTLLLGILLLLLLNANIGTALPGFAIGKLLCLALAPATFRIGHALLGLSVVQGLVGAASEAPVLALMNLHVYCLIGGIPVSIVAGLALGWLAAKLIRGLRLGIIAATGRSKRMEALAKNPLVRFLMWLVFGKQKKALSEAVEAPSPLFRKGGVIFAVVMALLFGAFELVFADYLAKMGLTAGLEAANGAEVNIGAVDLSLAQGRLSVSGVQMADPGNPTHNLLVIGELTGDVSVMELLAGRYTVDLLKGSDVRQNVLRESPGEVYRKPERGPEPEDSLSGYLTRLEKLNEYTKKLKDYLEKRGDEEPTEEQKRQEKEDLLDQARNRGYLALSARHLLAKRPAWVIRKIEIDGVVLWEGGAPQKLEGSELSSHPELNAKQTRLTLAPGAGGDPTADIVMNFDDPAKPHSFLLDLAGLPIKDALSDKAPVGVDGGQADLKAEGTFTAEMLNIPFTVALAGLQAQAREGKSVLGLDPATAQQVFQNLKELTLAGSIVGSPGSPRLKLDEQKVLAGMKDAMVAAGKAELANRVNGALGEATARAKDQIKDTIKGKLPVPDLGGKLPGVGDLIPGLGNKKPRTDDKDKKPDKPDPKKLLDKLF